MSEYHLILPWPPSNNTYYRHARGRNYISDKGKQYATSVSDIIQQQNLAVKTPHRLSVTIYASPPDIRTRDLDNLSKGVLDALTKAGFWLDDGQIDGLRIERLEKRKGGGLLVVVRELDGKLKRWEDILWHG